ncbi:phosphate ABC transporter substrate-binding/OmpA family protein [Pseudomonas putida]|uniref:substrate-binding domain-containing protein n=1 Tax=Pseudomonas putida TaxID=303 RepID=UPI0018E6B6C0|nr:phosphate ABC transporter substrate-binding/OmpA family protein [Pseudomonas putida]MBI6924582.1 phosphate ABC transporter substrate-binding/OmpA family protein [Pseudomonas putida]
MARLLALLLTVLPVMAWAEPMHLRIQGSNTLGSALLPALVQAQLRAEHATQVQVHPGRSDNETVITATRADGVGVRIDIAAHGSSTGFLALAQGEADLVAASRPISDSEARQLQAFGDLRSSAAEHVIGLDGVAILVNPANPLHELSLDQIAQVFSGRVQRWEQLGVAGGDIHLYARDERSGTFETFKARVLAPGQVNLVPTARRFEAADRLAAHVAADRQAIGFTGLSTTRGTKVLAVADGNAAALLPERALVASEDYPLSRRLFLYRPTPPSLQATALIDFIQSPAGQAIVAEQGFVSQQVMVQQVVPVADMPARYRDLVKHAQRLSVNFRFQPGNAALDSKAIQDVQRIIDYLTQAGKQQRKAVLVGFGDPKDTPGRAALLSRLRAEAVRQALARGGIEVLEVVGLGDQMPVAGNELEQGRLRNRRVEVWVY